MLSSSRASRYARWVAALAAAVASLWAVLSTPVLESEVPFLVMTAGIVGSLVLVLAWRLESDRRFLIAWVALAAGIGLFSVVSGFWNAMTEEPYTTPAFVQLFPNLYGGVLHLSYSNYGGPVRSVVTPYVYLPLLPLIQVPGLDYRYVTLAAWAGTVALVRRNDRAVALLGHPWLALLAANGFNDFVPLLLLTLVFVTPPGWKSRGWEIAALAVKQFANVILFGYYLALRRWRDALVVVAVTLLVIAPFFALDPSGTLCHALVFDWDSSCSGPPSGGPFASPHLNYIVWPVWIAAMWGGGIWTWLASPSRFGRWRFGQARS